MARLHGRGLDIFEGTGGFGRRRHGPGSLTLAVTVVVVLALAGAAGWVLLRQFNPDNAVPLVVFGMEGPDGQLAILAGAVVTGPDGRTATTGDDGATRLAFTPPCELEVAVAGYQDALFQVDALPPDGPLGLQLDPLVLNGRVKDHEGAGVIGAAVRLGELEATTDQMGAFQFVAVAPGKVQASKMAYAAAEADWDGSPGDFEITLEPFVVRGIRVSGVAAGSSTAFADLLDMIEGTVINTLVFDTKDEDGVVHYDSQVTAAVETGAVTDTYDVTTVLAEAAERGLYTITRIVTFQDPKWAPANPEHAARNTATGGAWVNARGLAWADPTDREAWEYPLDLAVEACRLGFDEVQFDYVRFPSDGDITRARLRRGGRRRRAGGHHQRLPERGPGPPPRRRVRGVGRHLRHRPVLPQRPGDRPAPGGVVPLRGRPQPDDLPQPLLGGMAGLRRPQRPSVRGDRPGPRRRHAPPRRGHVPPLAASVLLRRRPDRRGDSRGRAVRPRLDALECLQPVRGRLVPHRVTGAR